MAEIILVRHGQAQTGATSEADYDSLSDIGHQQAAWLGDWMRETNGHFDRVFSGSLSRQQSTVASMGFGEQAVVDDGWNEIDYFTLANTLEREHGVPFPTSREGFTQHLPQVFTAWAEGVLSDAPESYAAYLDRAEAAMHRAAHGGGRVLVVTSGGILGALFARILGLGVEGQCRMILLCQNTSVHRVEMVHGQTFLAEYGTTPHLVASDRLGHRSFV